MLKGNIELHCNNLLVYIKHHPEIVEFSGSVHSESPCDSLAGRGGLVTK